MKPFQRQRSGLAVQSGIEFLRIHTCIRRKLYIYYVIYIYIGMHSCELQGVHTSSHYNNSPLI